MGTEWKVGIQVFLNLTLEVYHAFWVKQGLFHSKEPNLSEKKQTLFRLTGTSVIVTAASDGTAVAGKQGGGDGNDDGCQ